MEFKTDSIGPFLKDILSLKYFVPDPEENNTIPIETKLDVGESKLVVITGENASGKSLIRRIISVALRKMNVECIHLSQEGRATEGIQRAFIYGAEEWESTGYISSKTVQKSIITSQKRENRHGIFWDEPDIGLSDNYAAGVGVKIRDFLTNSPDKLFVSFLVTHRKSLVEQLIPLKPWNLRLSGYPDLETWIKTPVIPLDPEKLHTNGLKLFRRLAKFIR